MVKYTPQKIEKKWQKRWITSSEFRFDEKSKKPKYYVLDMFPYPSSEGLHVGHPLSYTATDIIVRYRRMNGFNVLHPIGWDAFGLPAENYAIKSKVHPAKTTQKNIKNFTRQIKALGFSYDWSREVNTSDPEYYKWTQWLFLQLFKMGLAYKKKAAVNWCPSCQTVLANEQVVAGECERCGSKVVQKKLEQWFFKITDYAPELLAGLNKIDWPEKIKTMQQNWIGKSEGAEIDFEIAGGTAPLYVLLHGYTSSPDKDFFPWLKKELEKRGAKVYIPKLSNPDDPRVAEQVAEVLKKVPFNKDTILVGHSLGGVVAMKVLEQLRAPIRKTILVSSFTENKFITEPFESHTFDWKFDVKKIKVNAGIIEILRDTTDDTVPQYQADNIKCLFGGTIFDFAANKPHTCGDKEPEVLKHCIDSIPVFTTRPDTLFGATYLVLSPEHDLIRKLKNQIQNWAEVKRYIDQSSRETELDRIAGAKEKTGVELKSVKAVNPANDELIPIWVADYVLGNVGTGAIMAVPAHDERDFVFAKKFNLPIRVVVKPSADSSEEALATTCRTEGGVIANSGKFSGMPSEKAKWAITKFVGGKRQVQYRLRDWLISRQRYWGAPIPIIYCDKCGMWPVPEKDLPVKLPIDVDFRPKGESPLARSKKFHQVKCPKCGASARRESDTMDTFVDSSWYFLRYIDPKNKKQPFDREKVKKVMPVDIYVGGAEHAVLHLLYSRFITKALCDAGWLNFDEPFLKLRNQGLILGPDGQKMSKSRGNVINPDQIVEEFGADSMRMYEMFMGPLEDTKPWDTQGIVGLFRFLVRVWNYAQSQASEATLTTPELEHLTARTIKKVTQDINDFDFNTAVSSLMIFFNDIDKAKGNGAKAFRQFLGLLYPFAPHLSSEILENLGASKDFLKTWPKAKAVDLKEDNFDLIVQVNGKTRAILKLPIGISQADAEEAAKANDRVKKHLSSHYHIRFVKNRLINFVMG